jgi:hypothetical protein
VSVRLGGGGQGLKAACGQAIECECPNLRVSKVAPKWGELWKRRRQVEIGLMGEDLGNNVSRRDVKSIDKQLAELYSRRSTVESLIKCLESYAECQAKGQRRQRLKSA